MPCIKRLICTFLWLLSICFSFRKKIYQQSTPFPKYPLYHITVVKFLFWTLDPCSKCRRNEICENGVCIPSGVDLCEGVQCGEQAFCQDGACVCTPGYTGDPVVKCYEERGKFKNIVCVFYINSFLIHVTITTDLSEFYMKTLIKSEYIWNFEAFTEIPCWWQDKYLF